MALERKDRIKDQTTTTGTGTVNLDATAPTGFRTFVSAVTSGATVRYLIESADLTEWEVGEGVFTDATPDTLTRVTVYASSNSNALVSFSAGTKSVSLIFTARDTDDIAPPNLLKNGNFINNSTNGYGSTPDDWTSSNANPVQGGIPALTKQNLIDGIGVATGDIEGLWNLNNSYTDLSDNGYNLTDSGSPVFSDSGLMAKALDLEASSSQYATNAAANCNITGSQTWIAYIKPESIGAYNIIGIRASGGGSAHGIYMQVTTGKVSMFLTGLTTTTDALSDVQLQAGIWYMVVGVYDSANSKLKIWVNGVKKEYTASGSATSVVQNLSIGRWGAENGSYYDGLIQNACVLSVALTDNQVKKLFAATMYKGQKIRRATTDAYLYEDFPMDVVERLRGKTIAYAADAYCESINHGIYITTNGTGGTTTKAHPVSANTWERIGLSITVPSDATSIRYGVLAETTDGNSWFEELSGYIGSTILPYDHSKDDWSRFPNLLKMRFPHIYSGYQYEQFRLFSNPFTQSMRASGSMTVSSYSQTLSKYIYLGDSIQFLHTCSFTNGGTAHVANYLTLPFSIESTIVSASNGHAVQVVNNAVQEVGVARDTAKNEMEIYRYTGGNWSLAANQALHESSVFPIDIT